MAICSEVFKRIEVKTTEQPLSNAVTVERKNFDAIFASLKKRGYQIIGPTFRDGAIDYDILENSNDLPEGWTEEQDNATYRLKERKDKALFGFNSTPQSWKKFIHPPLQKLWQSKRNNGKPTITPETVSNQKIALLGVRACDLNAFRILETVFTQSPFTDTGFQIRRTNIFVIGVNCTQAGGTCFCASMSTGPGMKSGYDIVITEVVEKNRHYFVLDSGSKTGAEIIKELPNAEANVYEIENAEELINKASTAMGRKVDTTDIKNLLNRNSENHRWNQTALRCLTCANCTMVCPTCFCTTIEDMTDLTGSEATRVRRWDSCFTMDFSYIHGGSIRPSVYSRYRQWLTHKFSSWHEQFETSGCVGCGRCITWCPVGIDVTEEIAAIRISDKLNSPTTPSKENR
jgi:sulfhydrogenase subunit beta (sulfur reductase)